MNLLLASSYRLFLKPGADASSDSWAGYRRSRRSALLSPLLEQVLTDRMLEGVMPLLPHRRPNPKGVRPWADDRARLAGIVYVLCNGLRW